jgi:hypothetical protein
MSALVATVNPIILPGCIYEYRAPHSPQGTLSGYFEDMETLYAAAAAWDGKIPGAYVTLNPTKPALLARACNRIGTRAKVTTSDPDILRRCFLLIDIDPVRPAGISSTDAEHEAALARITDVVTWLTHTHHWPAPILADSGNGAHALYRIELPNDDASRDLLKAVLEVLALKFNDGVVVIDTTMYNAGRITKLYGTLVMNGDDMPDRPHRRSAILMPPPELIVVTGEQLEEIATLRPADPKPTSTFNGHGFDVRAFIARHGLTVFREKPWNGGTVFDLESCSFNPDHQRSACIIQQANGALGFRCFHNSCRDYRWQDLRNKLEPHRTTHRPGSLTDQPCTGIWQRLSTIPPTLIQWLWPGKLATGKLNLLFGDPGLGKSLLSLDVACRVTTGAAWPDQSGTARQGDVILLSAEDTLSDVVRPRVDLMRGEPARIHTLSAVRVNEEQERRFSLITDLQILEAKIRAESAHLAIIDPLSSYMTKVKDANTEFDVRDVLDPVAALAERTGCCILSVMHPNKREGAKAIHRVLNAVAFVGAPRMVWAVGKDPDDPQHRRFFLPVKTNIVEEQSALAFSTKGGRITWETAPVPEEVTADSILNAGMAHADQRRLKRGRDCLAARGARRWTGPVR